MIIIKIGGGQAIRENLDNILKDFAQLSGEKLIVHGANHEMKEISQKLGKEQRIVTSPSGYTSRYTDRETLEIFMMVYAGVANKRIVEKLQQFGVNAVGISGVDGKLLQGKRKPSVRIVEEGRTKILHDDYTGKVERANTQLLRLLLDNGYVPVICPPVLSYENEAINVDNDRIIAVLAEALAPDTIINLFEAPGLLRDHTDEKSLITHIYAASLDDAMDYAEGRMKKKILGTRETLAAGAKKIIFADGRTKTPIANALAGKGTTIA